MELCSERKRDPFLVTAERATDRYVLSQIIQDTRYSFEDPSLLLSRGPIVEPWVQKDAKDGKGGESVVGTRRANVKRSNFEEFCRRAGMAAFGGIFLIAPMWLITLHNTLYTGLVSTTVFVAVFGLIMAGTLDTYEAVVSNTAAYAAVLVVFVGLSTA
jgi:hypothetical protein